jgi:hypothetical protein
MTLSELLMAIRFSGTITAAVSAARSARSGVGGYALAATLGLTLGLICAWGMRALPLALAARLEQKLKQLCG